MTINEYAKAIAKTLRLNTRTETRSNGLIFHGVDVPADISGETATVWLDLPYQAQWGVEKASEYVIETMKALQ